MDTLSATDGVISVEVFAAKDSAGKTDCVFMAAPRRCGLQASDVLKVHGNSVMAMRGNSVLPIDFPDLDKGARQALAEWAGRGERLAVAELAPAGLYSSYYVDLEVVA